MLNELILPQRAVFVGGLVLCRRVRQAWVELVGVEPTSAQGNHTLSTRLFRTSFSCCGKTRTTNRNLILKSFTTAMRPCRGYFRCYCTAWPVGFGTTSTERCPVPSPCKGIKLTVYCASTKQREHTCCCQLIA